MTNTFIPPTMSAPVSGTSISLVTRASLTSKTKIFRENGECNKSNRPPPTTTNDPTGPGNDTSVRSPVNWAGLIDSATTAANFGTSPTGRGGSRGGTTGNAGSSPGGRPPGPGGPGGGP